MEERLYQVLNKGWNSACRMIFGREIGELKEYEDYLKEAVRGKEVSSCFSGSKLWCASENYPEGARFFDFSREQQMAASNQAEGIDGSEADIDSIVGKIQDKILYGCSKVFGNSQFVEHSDGIVDCTYILGCSMCFRSTNQAYTLLNHSSEYAYGCASSGKSSHIIRCLYTREQKRCFENSACVNLSDCMFCYNLHNSSHCMFSFNLRSKQYVIGNVQLERDGYFDLRGRLVDEIAGKLEKEKRLDLSILDILRGGIHDA